jgi:2-polyprenyl-6-methoxyphenol hydroxylase-like FAD-dependent oxidoreductase
MKNRKVLISGAGIAGSTLAYWLLRWGFEPTLIDRAPSPRPGGYMIDFWGLGYDVAERMNLLPVLLSDGYRIDELQLVDTHGAKVGGFDGRIFRSATDNRLVSLLRADLARRLYATVEGKVETMFSDSVRTLSEDNGGVDVTFERSKSRRFDLVVGADGLHSAVRPAAFGQAGAYERYLGYCAAAFSMAGYPYRNEGVYVAVRGADR